MLKLNNLGNCHAGSLVDYFFKKGSKLSSDFDGRVRFAGLPDLKSLPSGEV
jgi:hypothetical protein